jgi:hypothetical protein
VDEDLADRLSPARNFANPVAITAANIKTVPMNSIVNTHFPDAHRSLQIQ